MDKPCELKLVSVSGNSTVYSQVAWEYRLRNNEAQSDFLITPFNASFPKELSKLCGRDGVYYNVLGMNKVVVALMSPGLTKEQFTQHQKDIKLTVEPELELQVRTASHAQYMRDVVIDQENVLVRELQYL